MTRFFFKGSGDHRDLHSFPTRRSSDLAHVPLLATSRAIDAGGSCTEPDQLGQPRWGRCDLGAVEFQRPSEPVAQDRKSTRLNSSHANISYAVFCLKKKKNRINMKSTCT